MRRIILFCLVIITLIPALAFAQSRTVTGVVRDAGGVLPGATVLEKGVANNSVAADANGKFTITLRGTSNLLVVSFVGYTAREVSVANRTGTIDIILASNAQGLDEVMVVAYGKTNRITSTGAVSSIQASSIRTVPTANVQNALSGRLPGFFSTQTSGQPGRDASDFFIRGVSSLNPDGNRPLIIVDDMEYTYDQLQQINVNEIESISILKDASTTAVYGIKGANGILVVSTRRGKAGKPQVNLRTEGGLQSPTRTPKFLDAYNSALLINQAQANDGLPLEFTPQDLELFKNGTDPYGHPNVDWYNKIFDKSTYQVNTNLDISGGTEQVKYFISGGFLDQNGLMKHFPDPRGQIDNNYNFKRYNFRSNLDLKANKTLDLMLDVTTRFSNVNSPNTNAASALSEIFDFSRQTPFTAPFINPDGSYAYAYSRFNSGHLPTLNARIATGGYQNSKRTDYNILFTAKQKLDKIAEGLSARASIAYGSVEQFTRGTGNYGSIPSYHYDPVTKTTTKNPDGGYVFPTQFYSGNVNIYTTNVNLKVFGEYDRTFANKHHVNGLVVFNQQSQTASANPGLTPDLVGVPAQFRGVSMRGGYHYADKYLIDISASYNGTDRFAANNRYGWFPAVSVGYAISKEEFFKKLLPGVGLFKLRGSYGLVGIDAAPGNKYIYNQNYVQGGGYKFGSSSNDYTTYYEGSLSNVNVVWEKQKELNIGIDLNLLKNNALSLTFDYFNNLRYDQLITPNNVPLILGVGLPAVNIGRVRNQGFDGQFGYQGHTGNWQYGANLVVSLARNKILFQSESSPAYPWLARTGQPIRQPFGYHYLGYYTAADVAAINTYKAANGGSNGGNKNIAVPDNGQVIQPGDLKYEDLNGDGFINVFDQKAIGYPSSPPMTTMGLNLSAAYKGFSVSVLFQGSFGYSFIIQNIGIEPFQSQFQPIHQQAWTPSNADNAQFPRLTSNPTTVNSPSAYPSDYWLINAQYLRLKTIDMGYQFPTKLLPFKLNNARIYMSAYNLFTWTNFNKYQQDPEIASNTAGDAYINQRVVNLGIQLGF